MKTQHNAWIHLVATVAVICAGFFFEVSATQWSLLILAIVVVWLAEALNTAVEFLGDSITKDTHPLVGKAKDVAAGGVLIAAVGAAVIGGIAFGPHLAQLLK